MTLCIIPARGGSKGIPRKNLALVGGLPLVAHSILQARRAVSVSRVIVSTDDPEIAAVSRSFEAEVVDRPEELSGDLAPSEEALRHTLDHLQTTEGYKPELVVFLQPTSPLRRPSDIDDAVAALRREGADSLFSAAVSHGFVWRLSAAGPLSLNYDYRQRPRRQDAHEDVVENGSIYVFKPWVLRELNNRLGGRIAVFRMNNLNSFQVDDPVDLKFVDLLIRTQNNSGDSE